MTQLKSDYKKAENSIILGMSESEKQKLTDLQIICIGFHKAFEESNEEELLNLSAQFTELCRNIKIYPDRYIDEINIINDSGLYINTFHNPDFIRNILIGLCNIFQHSNYALNLFIDSNPYQLLIMILNFQEIDIRIYVYQIIEMCCRTRKGAEFITNSSLIQNCVQSLLELFQILSTDNRENSPYIDPTNKILDVLIAVSTQSPPKMEDNVDLFIDICKHCFESEHFFNFIKPGVKILSQLSQNGFLTKVLQSNLFNKIMSFLVDPRLRSSYVICLNFASYIILDNTNNNDESFFRMEAIDQIPIPYLITLFNQCQDDEELVIAIIFLFMNIVIMSSDYVQIFTNHQQFNDFMITLKALMGTASMETKKLTSWFIWNMLYAGMREQQAKIFETGILDYLEDSIEFDDEQLIINVIIKSIDRMIRSYRKNGFEFVEPYQNYLLRMRGFVRDLYYSENQNIHEAAQIFLKSNYPDLVLY